MVKQYISAVLEDLVGEYVLNISHEKLKLSTIKGKIKLENVELDGDFIGSHVLSAVGLSGFGVLSCWARRLQINIPWTNLDNEPTSLEIRGMHLICVPLLNTTTNRVYYGGGVDSSLSLRTRAKRAALARLERNFFSGRMHTTQQERGGDNDDDGNVLSYNGRRRQYSSSEDVGIGDDDEADNNNIGDSLRSNETTTTKKKQRKKEARIPALKRKLKAKVYGNLVSSVSDIHIRFEVPEGGLERSNDNTTSSTRPEISDERSFAFGLTLKSLTARNVFSGGESSGSIDTQTSNIISDTKRKKIDIHGLSIYWDDGPSFLISESDLFTGRLTLPASICQQRIAEAMQKMSRLLDPGEEARKSLSCKDTKRDFGPTDGYDEHDYICRDFSQTMHTTFCKGGDDDSLYFVEVLPCNMEVNLTPQQYRQYQRLKDAVLAQRRFDTMLHQRPSKSPIHSPRLWWKYAIACVRHNPTSRSWTDVQQIVKCRKPYIDLVMKNLLCESERSGFHGGLTTEESKTLLELENLLPLETLLSFHLLALRRVLNRRFESSSLPKGTKSIMASFTRRRSSSSLGRRLLNSLTGSSNSFYSSEDRDNDFSSSLLRRQSSFIQEERVKIPSLIEDDEISSTPASTTHTTCKLHSCGLKLSLLDISKKCKGVTLQFDFKGTSYDSGSGKSEITFDIIKFDVLDFVTSGIEEGSKVLTVEINDENEFQDVGLSTPFLSFHEFDDAPIRQPSVSQSRFDGALPSHRSVCRAIARADGLDFSLDLSAHPATVLWNQECAGFILDWSASVISVSQFISQLKNATTPGAHRAEIALLYPTSFSLSLDISTPKLWVPIAKELKAGALLLDAGKIHMNLTKPKQSMQTDVKVDIRNINILLAQEIYGLGHKRDDNDLTLLIRAEKKLVNIVQPFQIQIKAESGHSDEIGEKTKDDFSEILDGVNAGKVSVTVGAIYLNLIDVEKLSKGIGRFLASGVSRMRQISESGVLTEADRSLYLTKRRAVATTTSQSHATDLRVSIESVEMLLESYSSTESSPFDPNRSYLVDIRLIRIHKRSMGMKSFSRFSISDANVQLAEADQGTRKLKSATEQIFTSNFATAEKLNGFEISTSHDEMQTPNRKRDRCVQSKTPLRTPKSLSFFPVTPSSGLTPPNSSVQCLIQGCHFHDGDNHGDEIEFDIKPAIIKITPISIQDCAGAVKRLFECGLVISREMERRVHEGGRIARASSSNKGDVESSNRDSSLLFRVTMKDATVLLGRPASDFFFRRNATRSDYVIQILTKASFIGQSIENDDGSGSRTLHLSVDDFAASINTTFDRVELNYKSPKLVAPTSADVRAVYKTVDEGRTVSQDFSFDVESMKICIVPHDIQVIVSVLRKVLEKLDLVSKKGIAKRLSPFLHSKNKGSSIATRIRAELYAFSFVIMRSFKPRHDVRPFLDIHASQMKVNVEGCAAFLADLSVPLGVKFFNPGSLEWEDLMEPNMFLITMEMMPSETMVLVSSNEVIRTNCSAVMMQQIASIEQVKNIPVDLIEQRNGDKRFYIVNQTGLELSISLHEGNDRVAILPGETCLFESSFTKFTLFFASDNVDGNLSLVAATSKWKWGEALFRLGSYDSFDVEPVVEFVIENQRLIPDISDVYSIEKGQDLLDSMVWSPALSSVKERKWLPPYHLEGDVPQWSDTTCTITRTKHSVELPDSSWIWINDWEVAVDTNTDADGWDYAPDFVAFDHTPRHYRVGDSCRRRRWTRTRVLKRPKSANKLSNFFLVLETFKEAGNITIKARSRFKVVNETSLSLSILGLRSSQDEEVFLGSVAPAQTLCVPLLQSATSFIRLATLSFKNSHLANESGVSEPIMIIPTGFTSNRMIRISFRCDLSRKTHHFLLHLKSNRGVVDIIIQPVLTLLNLLPCQLQIQLGEVREGYIEETEAIAIDTGNETHCSVDCQKKPHISIRVPGYQWSRWNMIINRESNTKTWLPREKDEGTLYETSSDDPHGNEFKTILHLQHTCNDGPRLKLIMSVEPGHVPVIRVYAQYWIIDKTALGLNFSSGTKSGSEPDLESLRTTYLSRTAQKHTPETDMKTDGHQWSLGMCGMTLFFSSEKSISFAVGGEDSLSKWSSSIDIAKPMPESVKTAISVDALDGSKRFELAYSVTVCPLSFSRTSVIEFFPRYQVVNLIGEDIYVAQEGALTFKTRILTQSCVYISGLGSDLPAKIRFSVVPDSDLWTLGSIELDKIGITSIRIPTVAGGTLVVQCEVRLASKKQDSAVVVVIWVSNEDQNPLYLLKNTSKKTVFCAQLLSQNNTDQASQQSENLFFVDNFLQCGSSLDSFDDDDLQHSDFVWTLKPGESKVFGFCNPERSHLLQWSVKKSDLVWLCANTVEVDTVGFRSIEKELTCTVQADKSTKVVLFSCDDNDVSYDDFAAGIEDFVALSLKVDLPGVAVSVVDNASKDVITRELFLVNIDDCKLTISQSREGFHELEVKLARLQVDNFIFDTSHRVLLSSKLGGEEFLRLTLVRRLQEDEATIVLSYAAFKLLDLDICLDRKTAETITRFIHPFHRSREDQIDKNWIATLTSKLTARYSRVQVKASHEIEKMAYTANTGRVYLQHLHIHPIRFYLTFTQQEIDTISVNNDPVSEDYIVSQLIREMASIANAPIIFTSFIVSNVFESSLSLAGIIGTHYSSQLSNQMFSILGSLTILKVPADFLSNVGSGVKDFFYEPIQGLVHGPEEFLTGLEAGTFSLARGVVVAFVRGAADVTYLLSDNLASLTSDAAFIGERNLYHKQLMYADSAQRTVQDTLAIAGSTVARGFQSAASGILEQPKVHFSKQGASGLVIGARKAIIGALVKPVVGLGDAAVVVMNHGLEATIGSLKGNKRLRRALPSVSSGSETKTKLVCYDEMSAKIQQQVTKGDTIDDVYLGHILTQEHLIIASDKYLWIIENESVEPRCISWGEISYFEASRGYMKIDVFSKQGTQSHLLSMGQNEIASLCKLLLLKLDESRLVGTSFSNLAGIKQNQGGHVFGSFNIPEELDEFDDEDNIVRSCCDRVNILGSFMPSYFHDLDQEAWLLINSLTQLFSGWSSRRCVVVGLINATNESIQIKSINMVEGGSPCRVIPTIEYDKNNAVLHPGGVLLCVGWGHPPSSVQAGRAIISIETNSFACSLGDSINHTSSVEVLSGYKVGFLEKSFDESGWWAKYWMLLQVDNSYDEGDR